MMTECHWWCVSLSYHGMGCVCCSHPTWCVGSHIHVTKLFVLVTTVYNELRWCLGKSLTPLTLSLYHSWVFVYICTFILVSFFLFNKGRASR